MKSYNPFKPHIVRSYDETLMADSPVIIWKDK